ncbi:MAG: cyclic nucleotide-binding domain-containing protein [Nitrososphaera sp.]|nr:cyclic nucleotide-binding domain-containing protein [Nitrososphaera sp.]
MMEQPDGLNWRYVLRAIAPFSQLSDKDLDDLLQHDAQEMRIAPGKPIVREGDPPDYLFVLGRGRASVTLFRASGREVQLAMLEAGEIFGEMGLIQEKPRMATVTAEEPCLVLRIEGQRFLKRLHESPEDEFKVLLMMSERLRILTQKILTERLAETDERVTGLQDQLQTELRIAEATKRATQAMFDETHKRASEVIESFERTRAYFTWVGSALSTFVAVLVFLAGFFGLSEYQDFLRLKESVGGLKADVNKQLILLEDAENRVKEISAKADSLEGELDIVTPELWNATAKQSEP